MGVLNVGSLELLPAASLRPSLDGENQTPFNITGASSDPPRCRKRALEDRHGQVSLWCSKDAPATIW